MTWFMDELRRIVPIDCKDRPFVCDGRPEDCQFMIVGENPAVRLDHAWWEFWDGDRFNMARFDDVYTRKTNGKKTKTRTRIDKFLGPLRKRGIQCIDTNADRNELAGGSRNVAPNDDVLDFLLQLPRLRAVLAHGRKAHAAVAPKITPEVVYFQTAHFCRVRNDCLSAVQQQLDLVFIK